MNIPPFQAMLAISIIILILVVFRLYEAIKVLNARVTLLSTQLRQLRSAHREITPHDAPDTANAYDQHDDMLQRKMKRDFSYKNKSLEALLNYQSDWAKGGRTGEPEKTDKPRKAPAEIRGVTLKPEMKQVLQAVRELQHAAGSDRRAGTSEDPSHPSPQTSPPEPGSRQVRLEEPPPSRKTP